MVQIINLTNGILFDASAVPGAGETIALKIFIPKNYPGINNISLYNNKVVGTGSLGRQFNLTIDGSQGSYPVSEIGVPGNLTNITSLEELFEQFVEIL